MWILIIAPDGSSGPPVDLGHDAGEWIVGRQAGCGIFLDSPKVSRKHARIFGGPEAWFVSDAGSTGGTRLNGVKVTEPAAFSPGDPIEIAGFTIILSENASRAPEAAKPVKFPAREVPKVSPPEAPKPLEAAEPVPDEFKDANLLYTAELMALKKRIHEYVLGKLNLTEVSMQELAREEMHAKLEDALDLTLRELRHELPRGIASDQLHQALMDELAGYGPLSPLLRAEDVDEIMVNGPDLIFVERKGRIYETGAKFFNNRHLISIIQRIVEPLGRHVDDASPMVDARLPDGSRVNAVIPPLALDGASVTIRKFAKKKLTSDDLIRFGSMTREIALFLEEAVRASQNILISGGTGSGKTTLLNVISQYIPEGERIVTIEDSAELKLTHRNLVRLEGRPANIEGKGRISIRDLVINALRMRPDRIIVGECRGAEALDMLQAMNTGHDGSLTTCHANTPRDAVGRLENMVMMAGYDLPVSAIREQIASALNLIVQQTRLSDGSRKIVQISEITGREKDIVLMQDIFNFVQTGLDGKGRIQGYYAATGNIPSFVDKLKAKGDLRLDISVFVPKN
ncbi:MAG: putative conjugal transfer protein [Lentisphaerae bacterium ADurb.Bin242]|nr:MAG: putative conjugal transfer protein [Lentisphaerae bacterium ADurb.Bin242]